MKPFAILLAPAALVAGALTFAPQYKPQYKAEQSLRVEVETSMTMETVEMKLERDGEPIEGRNPGGGGASETKHVEVHVDEIVEVEKGAPTKVKRTFEKLAGSRSRGDESRDFDSPLQGVAIQLTPDGDKASVEVVEGSAQNADEAFAHERLALFLDAGLPEGEVEPGASWDLSKEQILALLRVDAQRGLFPPPPPEEGAGEGGGRRRGGMVRMGGGDAGLLARADWKGKATLKSPNEDVDGVACAVIELALEADGEIELPQRGEGGRDRMYDPAATALGTTYSIELEGTLAFALEKQRAHSLAVEGKLSTTTDEQREGREGGTLRIYARREGKVEISVKVSEEAKK